MLQWDLWSCLSWHQHWKLWVSSRYFHFALSLCNLSGCSLWVVCTFPCSQHYSWSIFKADRVTRLQSLMQLYLGGGLPYVAIKVCIYKGRGGRWGEKKKDTHTHPTCKVIKQIHTHACPYIHTSPHRSSALFLRSSVKLVHHHLNYTNYWAFLQQTRLCTGREATNIGSNKKGYLHSLTPQILYTYTESIHLLNQYRIVSL